MTVGRIPCLYVDPMVFKEEFPTFWGIFTSYVEGSYVYNYARGELTFTLRKGASSASPRLKGPSDVYSVQVRSAGLVSYKDMLIF